MLVGEAVSLILIKRLEDAERDGDRIYAVVAGVGASSDGKAKSIYAPNSKGHALALRRAYADAGFSPSTVRLIEAHGTGTPAGDLSEFTSLNQVLKEAGTPVQSVGLGSVKSMIGHTKSAAGAVSLTKAALALYHKILPATINVDEPNPAFKITESPLYINTETRPWTRAQNQPPRRIGISSLGFGGTNYHVVLEEYSAQSPTKRLYATPKIVLLSAPAPEQLLQQCQALIEALKSDKENAYRQLPQATRISSTDARLGFVAISPEDALTRLEVATKNILSNTDEWQHPTGIFYRRHGIDTRGKIVALFPGQGSQYANMGRELTINFPELRTAFEEVDALFWQDGETPLSQIVYPIPAFDEQTRRAQEEAITQTQYAQPAIGAISLGLYRILHQAGFQPDFVAGHSFGELTALWASAALTDADFVRLIKDRGNAMKPLNAQQDSGTMVEVSGDIQRLQSEIKSLQGITIANWNSQQQVVIAGARSDVASAKATLAQRGYTMTDLPVSAAFHTPLVGHAQQIFANDINEVTFSQPRMPVYSNSTGQPYPGEELLVKWTLTEHILRSVCFEQEIRNIYEAGGRIFVEIGPRNILTNLVKEILGNQPNVAIALNPSRQKDADYQMREAVVHLQVDRKSVV